jgi:hypothetical protein
MSTVNSIASSLNQYIASATANKTSSAIQTLQKQASAFSQVAEKVQTQSLATTLSAAIQKPAQLGFQSKFSQDQYSAIKGAWNLAKDSSDPAVLKNFTDQMTQYGVSASDISLATNTGTTQIADFLQNRAGMPVGFGGVNANGYVGVPDKPAPTTYSDYFALNTTPITDPTQNWLRGSSQPLNESEWNAQQATIKAEKARGVA